MWWVEVYTYLKTCHGPCKKFSHISQLYWTRNIIIVYRLKRLYMLQLDFVVCLKLKAHAAFFFVRTKKKSSVPYHNVSLELLYNHCFYLFIFSYFYDVPQMHTGGSSRPDRHTEQTQRTYRCDGPRGLRGLTHSWWCVQKQNIYTNLVTLCILIVYKKTLLERIPLGIHTRMCTN